MAIKYDPILGKLKQERGLQKQVFEATASQTVFIVTKFSLNDNYCIERDGIHTEKGHSRSGQNITFTVGLPYGTEIVVID